MTDVIDEYDSQEEKTVALMERLLTQEAMTEIKGLGCGATREAILSWCLTGEGLSRKDEIVVGYVSRLANRDIRNGEAPDHPSIYEDISDCHWGHVGIRFNDTMRFYPISRSEREELSSVVECGSFEDAFLRIRTQNDKLLIVNCEHVEEIAFLHEAADWPDYEEWTKGGGYGAVPGARDRYVAIYESSKNDSELLTDQIRALIEAEDEERYGRLIEAATEVVVSTGGREWCINPDEDSFENLLEQIEGESEMLTFADAERGIERNVFRHGIRYLEIPLSRYDDHRSE